MDSDSVAPFSWMGLKIRLAPCELVDKNKDWLNANIVYEDNLLTSLVSGLSVLTQWTNELELLIDKEKDKIRLNISSVLVMFIQRDSLGNFEVKVEVGEDPLLEVYSDTKACNIDDMNDLLMESRKLVDCYKNMINE